MNVFKRTLKKLRLFCSKFVDVCSCFDVKVAEISKNGHTYNDFRDRVILLRSKKKFRCTLYKISAPIYNQADKEFFGAEMQAENGPSLSSCQRGLSDSRITITRKKRGAKI